MNNKKSPDLIDILYDLDKTLSSNPALELIAIMTIIRNKVTTATDPTTAAATIVPASLTTVTIFKVGSVVGKEVGCEVGNCIGVMIGVALGDVAGKEDG